MRYIQFFFLMALLSGCASAATNNSSVSTAGQAGVPPTAGSVTSSEPVPLPELGADVWLIEDWMKPDVVVRTDDAGAIRETIWEQDLEVVGSFDAGHTLVCDDVDLDGEVDLVDLRFGFDGTLKNTYVESRSVGGEAISETTRPVDGTSVPAEVHQICGRPSVGPQYRLTVLQWNAALDEAGFTDIAGDHAIDPVWEAGANWNGVEYWPLNLYQGEFRPESSDETVLIACELGAIEIPDNLPEDARSALMTVSGC